MSACAACLRENPPGAKFCAGCGIPLSLPCASCGAPAQADAAFCIECGTAITPPSETPPLTATVSIGGERKHITVLFADVAGSMDLQERLDPEAWAQIMGRFVSILAEGIRKYGGTVDKFTGDGIMALFGAPVAQEDHARRACHAAWHLTKTIGEYSKALREEQGVELHVRLGLNSGEVVVGRVGEDMTLDPTALGHTVGLAQRMEAMAEPRTVYLTEYTARLVEGWFDLRDLGTTTVKGARQPLRIYVLEGASASPPVRRAASALGAGPLVGRIREFAVLEDALAAAREGEAQVVGVVGEAGVGKSRLCDEFAQTATAQGITVRRASGVSHGRDVPLLPILAMLRDYFAVTETDDAEQSRTKITRRVLELDPAAAHALPLLLDFLQVPDPAHPAPQLAPDVRMRRIFETLRRITQRRSEREVLILMLEDLHWFDAQSEVFLERLIESFPGSRTLVVTNFRPEFSARWMRHSYYRQLPLAPLRGEAVSQLLGGLLGVDMSLAPLLSFILERTGGNPFFVEEVVRALVEEGALAGSPGNYRLMRPLHEVKVPPSVQAVLAGRIDRLASDEKALLQTAAVVGRSFSRSVLARVSGRDDEELEERLRTLCSGELLQQIENQGMTEYRFWHPLTQQVAYDSLLAERRARLHGAVAKAMIELNADRLDEQAALIANHFERAGQTVPAARWNDTAATWALRSDVGEAMRRWRITIAQLETGPETDDTLRLGVRARQRLIRFGARTGMGLDEAGRLYAAARAAAERLQDLAQLASVTFAYGSTNFWRGAVREGLDNYFEAARLSDQTDDADAQAGYWTPPALVSSFTGPVSEALRAVERVASACGGDPGIGVSVLSFSPLSALGYARAELLSLSGQVEEARAELDQGLAIARARGEAEWIAWTLSVYPRLARTPNEFEASLAGAHEALRIAEDTGNTSSQVVALGGAGIAEIGLGRFAEAAATLEHALAEARQRQIALFEEARILAHLARAHLGVGQKQAALQAADEAVEVARRQGARVLECLALLTRAQVGRSTGMAADAVLADLDAALSLVKETGAVAYEPFIGEERGRLRNDEAELREALRLYRQIGATGDARRLEAELSSRTRR